MPDVYHYTDWCNIDECFCEKRPTELWLNLRILVEILWRHDMKNTQPHLEVGLGISRMNADSQWNPVYNAFHRILVVETNRFVGSFVNVILMRTTCGQRSSRAAESKR